MFLALSQNDRNRIFPCGESFFGSQKLSLIHDALFKGGELFRIERFLNHDLILFFMCETRMEESLGDATIVGQYDETLGCFVEPADREDAWHLDDVSDGALFDALRRMRDDAPRFVVGDVDELAAIGLFDGDIVGIGDAHAELSLLSVDEDASLFDQRIRFTSGSDAMQREIAVETHRGRRVCWCWYDGLRFRHSAE